MKYFCNLLSFDMFESRVDVRMYVFESHGRGRNEKNIKEKEKQTHIDDIKENQIGSDFIGTCYVIGM